MLHKGAACDPDDARYYATGIALPAVALLLQTITVIGLLEIGNILANPLSPAKEGFAICHLVRRSHWGMEDVHQICDRPSRHAPPSVAQLNHAAASSLSVVSMDAAPAGATHAQTADRENTNDEEMIDTSEMRQVHACCGSNLRLAERGSQELCY